MKLSFGMIFSIILIVAFIAFAVYGIQVFLDIQDKAKIASFVTEFQSDVDSIWRSPQGTQKHTYSLPKVAEEVCFKQGDEFENMFLKPVEATKMLGLTYINHLQDDTLCLAVERGSVSLVLKKTFSDELVSVSQTP